MIENTNIKRSDLLYVLISIVLSVAAAILTGLNDQTILIYAVLAVMALIFAIMVFLRPQFGVFVLVLAVYLNISRQFTDRGFPGITAPLVGITFLSIVAFFMLSGRMPVQRPRTSRIELMLFVYAIIVSLSFFIADDKGRAMEKIIDLIKDFVIIYCVLFAIQNLKHWKQAIWIIIIVVTFLSAIGLFQVVTKTYDNNFFGLAYVQVEQVVESGDSGEARLSGPVNAPNLWAQILAAVLPLAVYRMLDEKRHLIKFFCFFAIGLMIFGLLYTYSRGGYLAFGFILLLILIEQRANLVYAAISMILISLLVFQFAPAAFTERIMSLKFLAPTQKYGIQEDSSFQGRASEALAGMSMFADHPFLGVGIGNYENNYQKYSRAIGIEERSEERQAHSLYVQLLAETGIFGAAAFFGMVYLLIVELNRVRQELGEYSSNSKLKPWLTSLLFSLVAYMTTSIFLHGAYIRYFWIIFALAIIGVHLSSEIMHSDNRYYSEG